MTNGVFEYSDCIPESKYDSDFTNRVVVLSPSALKPECRNEKNQLWLATSGFGCRPGAIGKAVYAVCLSDGEQARWNRGEILGALRPELLPDWAKINLGSIADYAPDSSHDYVGYSFLEDGWHSPGVPLKSAGDIMKYIERQKDYQHRIMVCDRLDRCLLEIKEQSLVFPALAEQQSLEDYISELSESGGMRML